MLINNFEQIEKLMEFEEGSSDYYKFCVIVRNKDGLTPLINKTAKSGETLIKEWYVNSREYYEKVKSEIAAIVPTSSLQEVMRSINVEMEDIEILFDEAQVRFRLGEIEITSKLIDGSFPDYRQLIPKKASSSVVLDRSELTRVTKLAALFAREVGGSIVCEAKLKSKVFSVSSVANEFGENDSEISADIKKDDKVTLNSRFLMDALNVLEEKNVIFNFSDNMLPIVIKNEKNNNYTHIIMPLKV